MQFVETHKTAATKLKLALLPTKGLSDNFDNLITVVHRLQTALSDATKACYNMLDALNELNEEERELLKDSDLMKDCDDFIEVCIRSIGETPLK